MTKPVSIEEQLRRADEAIAAGNTRSAEEFVAELDRSDFIRGLRYIATSCEHHPPNIRTAGHIYKPAVGGWRHCAPCHAWRVLNGTPDGYDDSAAAR